MSRYKGRNYLVLGASGRIGASLCRLLRSEGAQLLLAARREEPLRALADEIGATYRVADATSFLDVENAAAQAVEHHGALDGIVNTVGGGNVGTPAHLTMEPEWATTIASTLGSAFAVVRAAALTMESGGAVVLISSAAASIGLLDHDLISAAAAGVEGLTRSAAATYAPRLRVNAVASGLRGMQALTGASSTEPAPTRAGEPADIASAVAFLLDPANAWITGQVLGVDGGLSYLRARAAWGLPTGPDGGRHE